MQKAGFIAHGLGDMGQEGDHIVLGRPFDLVDALGVPGRVPAPGPDGLGRLGGDDPQLRHPGRGVRLDFEPDPVFGLG